jgi:hypothetical protein
LTVILFEHPFPEHLGSIPQHTVVPVEAKDKAVVPNKVLVPDKDEVVVPVEEECGGRGGQTSKQATELVILATIHALVA